MATRSPDVVTIWVENASSTVRCQWHSVWTQRCKQTM